MSCKSLCNVSEQLRVCNNDLLYDRGVLVQVGGLLSSQCCTYLFSLSLYCRYMIQTLLTSRRVDLRRVCRNYHRYFFVPSRLG